MVPPRASVASAALAITAVLAIGRLAAFVSILPGSWPEPRGLRAGDVGSLPLAAGRTAAPHAAGALVIEQVVACGAAGLIVGAAVAAARSRRAGRPQIVGAQHPDGRAVSLQAFKGDLGVQAPGDLWDPVSFAKDSEKGGVSGAPKGSVSPAREAEIANGRLAMIASTGNIFQDGLARSAWGNRALYADLPLRAIEDGQATGAVAFNPASQVGATAPLGYWDPCGFSTDKDEDNFLKLRGIELKHGRVAMVALLGFWAEHYWHFPGFRDVPNGLAALTAFPGSVGIAFVFLIAGILELGLLPDLERGNPPGNFGDPGKFMDNKPIGGYEDKWRNFEINHGRIAMFGAIGTITANGYTGQDAFEQWQAARPVAIALIKTTIWWAP